jgi:hypothetical protein
MEQFKEDSRNKKKTVTTKIPLGKLASKRIRLEKNLKRNELRVAKFKELLNTT